MRGGLVRAAPFLRRPRYEVFPAPSTEDAVLEWVPPDITVTVTASPAKGLGPTIDLAEGLSARGYRVVPHLSARLVADDAHLADIVARLTACGIDDVFVPAGDADPPAGRFDSALLLWDKRHHAAYLVSNLCFNPATLRKWIARVRARGVTLPLFVGIAGPVDRSRLVRMAATAGVAESARFLAGHTEWLLRLGTPGAYSPDRLLERTGATLATPASAVEGLHVFTFNQVRQTEQWRRALLDRLGGRQGGTRDQVY
jgi:methylenetetrahydrofolate reductase (NADPH)